MKFHTVTPRIVAHDAQQLVDFIKLVFDATGDYSADRPAVITIGDSNIMISDAGVRSVMPAFLYVYVADADATYRRAIKAGARSIEERRMEIVRRVGRSFGNVSREAFDQST